VKLYPKGFINLFLKENVKKQVTTFFKYLVLQESIQLSRLF